MSFIKITEDNENLGILVKNDCVMEITSEMYRCNCGSLISLDALNKANEFFYCHRCNQSRKLNLKNVIEKKSYLPIPQKIKELVKEKMLKSDLNTKEKFKEIITEIGDSRIPINILEFANPSSLLPDNNSIILYYDIQEYEKIKNVYSEKRIYELKNFFSFNKESINQIFSNQAKKINSSKILEIKEEISNFCKEHTFDDFETIILNLFKELKQKSTEVEEFLNYLKRYQNTFIAKKPILIGSTNPSDIEFIDLFGYFNDLFNWNQQRGVDAKMYIQSKISKKTITDKILSNYAKEMVIVTNQDCVEPSAWRYIWDSNKSNGNWKFFIIDFDLLSILVYYFNLFHLIKPSEIQEKDGKN